MGVVVLALDDAGAEFPCQLFAKPRGHEAWVQIDCHGIDFLYPCELHEIVHCTLEIVKRFKLRGIAYVLAYVSAFALEQAGRDFKLPSEGRVDFWDEDVKGLGLRVSSSGAPDSSVQNACQSVTSLALIESCCPWMPRTTWISPLRIMNTDSDGSPCGWCAACAENTSAPVWPPPITATVRLDRLGGPTSKLLA